MGNQYTNRFTKEEISKVRELRSQGYTIKEIANTIETRGFDSIRSFLERNPKINNLKYSSLKNEGGVTMDLKKIPTDELLEEASKRGFMHSQREILMNRYYKFPRQLKPFKLGVVSDTHLGSQLQQITLLREAYKIFENEGIKDVLHAGDLVEGNGKQYKGQLYEMFIHGADQMIEYAVKAYPVVKGITTHVIGGSHDYSFWKSDGTDVLKKIAEKRPDIDYLGMSGAYINFGKISIYLMHPSGGVPYARSYRLQKTIEQFPPHNKPNILFVGHLHITCSLPTYRNVTAFQLPCFQLQTQYLREKGLNPDIGFLIMEIFPDAKGISSYRTQWYPFYQVIEGDY